jgi:hypothetical protein
MRPATGLSVVAVGAILAFAITAQPSFINLQIAGIVLIITGVAGLLIPERHREWLRRRVVVRRGSYGQAAGAPQRGRGRRALARGEVLGGGSGDTRGEQARPQAPGGGGEGGPPPAMETIEEYIPE